MAKHLAVLGVALAIFVSAAQSDSYAQSSLPRRAVESKDDAVRGVLEAFRNTEVASSEVGILREVYVKPGDSVKAGQAIARLDDAQQRIQFEEADLEWQSQGVLETAQHEYEFNQKKLVALQDLAKRTRVSPLELSRDELEMQIAHSKWIAQREAKEIARARMMRAENALSERTIRAPHDGIVVEILRDPGEYLAANQPVVARIVDTTKLRARFYLNDDIAQHFRNHPNARIRLPGGMLMAAEIEFIAPIASENSTEMTVLIRNDSGEIRSSSCDLMRP